MSGFTPEQVAVFYRRQGRAVPADLALAVPQRLVVPHGVGEELKGQFVQAAARGGRKRHEDGRMNGLERRYFEEILTAAIADGTVRYWAFEAIKLRLADRTWWKPDFWLLLANGKTVVDEVKGHWEDDARVKVKVISEMYPWLHIRAWTYDRKTKVWKREEF